MAARLSTSRQAYKQMMSLSIILSRIVSFTYCLHISVDVSIPRYLAIRFCHTPALTSSHPSSYIVSLSSSLQQLGTTPTLTLHIIFSSDCRWIRLTTRVFTGAIYSLFDVTCSLLCYQNTMSSSKRALNRPKKRTLVRWDGMYFLVWKTLMLFAG